MKINAISNTSIVSLTVNNYVVEESKNFFQTDTPINNIVLSTDSKWLFASFNNIVAIIDASNSENFSTFQTNNKIQALFLSSKSKYLAVIDYHNVCILFKIKSGVAGQSSIITQVFHIPFENKLMQLCSFSCDEYYMTITGLDNYVFIYALENQQIHKIHLELEGQYCVKFHPYEKSFLAVSTLTNNDIILYDIDRKVVVETYKNIHNSCISVINFDSSGNLMLSASFDQTFSIINLSIKQVMYKCVVGITIRDVDFLGGYGSDVIITGNDNTLYIYSLETSIKHELILPFKIYQIAFQKFFSWEHISTLRKLSLDKIIHIKSRECEPMGLCSRISILGLPSHIQSEIVEYSNFRYNFKNEQTV